MARQPPIDGSDGDIAALIERVTLLEQKVGAIPPPQFTAAEVTALKALVAGSTPVPPPTPDVREAIDFTLHNAGHYLQNGFRGKGRDVSIFRVKAGSSTKPTVTTGTTPYRIVRMGNLADPKLAGLVASDFTVEGYQGQVTHGLTIAFTIGALIERIATRGIKGQGTVPPGETFSLELHRSIDPILRDVLLDGRLTPTSAPVSSSLLGFNSVDGGIVERLVAQYAAGFGAALWQSGNYRLVAPDFRFCRRAINCERPYGDIYFDEPDLRNRTGAQSSGPDIVVATSGWTPTYGPDAGVNQTSAHVVITKPVWDRNRGWPLTVGVPTPGKIYEAGGGTPHTQRAEDVEVVVETSPGVTQTFRGPIVNQWVRIGDYWN